MERIKLGSEGLVVSKQGLGCMSMSDFYGPPKPEPEMIELIHRAIDAGVTFLDTADYYGPHTNEILIGKALKGVRREKVVIATKFGMRHDKDRGETVIKGDPAYVRAACEASLRRLDTPYIDLYYVHRIDNTIPIELTMGELKKLVEEGKIKYVGLSEGSVSTIRRAHAVHPITAIQTEWSLWSRDHIETKLLPTCRELDIGIVANCPLGRGFFADGPKVIQNLSDDDFRKDLPRFQTENLETNKVVYEQISEMAAKKNCTPAQLALAWVHHQGDDVCPIPGTTRIEHLNENIKALSVKLNKVEMTRLSTLASLVKGERFSSKTSSWMNRDTPPLSI